MATEITEDAARDLVGNVLGTSAWVESTGGGCRAIVAGPLEGGGELWVTDVTGCRSVPDGDGSGWLVGVYASPEDVGEGRGRFVESAAGASDLDSLRESLRRALS